MNARQLLRMTLWTRHPPSARRVKLVLAVCAICALIVGAEKLFGLPEGLAPERIHAPSQPITN